MKKIAALAVLAFSFASCESFLDTTNYWSKDSSNFPVNATDAEQMLAGIYNNLNVSIGNNLEAKVRNLRDTTGPTTRSAAVARMTRPCRPKTSC